MYGEVTSLYDIHSLTIPPEYLDTAVTDAEVNARHAYLAAAYGEQVPAEVVDVGDCAVCICQSGSLAGRTVPLYPGKNFPQTLEAEHQILGKRVGQVFAVRILQEECILRLERVIRTIPAAVDDALIARMGADGITTLAEYDASFRAKESAGKRERNRKNLGRFLLRELTERCVFSYDSSLVEDAMQREYLQLEQQGRAPENSEFRSMFLERLNQNLMLTEVCRRHGVTVTEDDVKDNVNQMLEMYALMGETAPDPAALTQEYIQAEYYTRGMDILLQEIQGTSEAEI